MPVLTELPKKSEDVINSPNKKEKTIETINLRNIQKMTFTKKSENLKNKKNIKKDTALQIYINNKSHDFVFKSKDELEKFVGGIVYLYQKYILFFCIKLKDIHQIPAKIEILKF